MTNQRKVLQEVFLGKKPVSTFSEGDKEWLKRMAQAGSIHAIWCLIEGMQLEVFTEGKGERESLAQMLYNSKERMSNEELEAVCDLDIETTPFGVELVMRGKKEGASWIYDTKILQDLCDKGNRHAARQLYLIYMYGDEELGIAADEQKAKEYYELAGDTITKWDMMDDDKTANELEAIRKKHVAYMDRLQWEKDKTVFVIILFVLFALFRLIIPMFFTEEKGQRPTTLLKQQTHRQDTIDYDKIEVDYDTSAVYDKRVIEELKRTLPGNPIVFIDGKRATKEDEETLNVRSVIGISIIRDKEAKDGILNIKTWNGPRGD